MIRVAYHTEYPGFDAEVRQPGRAYLAINPNPTSQEFKKKNFWTKALPHLHISYAGVCAYTSIYLPDQYSVDHFKPKAHHPEDAYEWKNFRLASGRVNSTKGNQTEILDPFEIENDWFFIDIPSCLLRPNPALDKDLRIRIKKTIGALSLNQDDKYAQERCNILIAYANEDVSLDFLNRRYPFLGKEIIRQALSRDRLREFFRIE